MDEEREEGAPTSKTTLSGEHGRQSKAKSPEQRERADSPGPSCVSLKSDWSMDYPHDFRDGIQSIEKRVQKERADSPGPSCVSLKSDRSMGHPPDLKDRRPSREEGVQKERADSPGPSCVSLKSDWSMDRPPRLKDGCPSREEGVQKERADSPGPSCVSLKSNWSMDFPPELKDGRPSREERRPQERSKVTSAQSVQQNQAELIKKERADSPGPSCVSMKSNWSMDRPPGLKDGRPSREERQLQERSKVTSAQSVQQNQAELIKVCK
ncbi:uncharacterized protein LOC115537786 isoform X2 [Gadus morhua]|uniref:uncharacterized protein LOC115537786 isoform X2 n=1 Tax=Gadus morhua TaxID=8049 RepID=UPI0011B5C43B|nr:uncharacterized protein LOC115537786 isoform X2 [Gadus morhua]